MQYYNRYRCLILLRVVYVSVSDSPVGINVERRLVGLVRWVAGVRGVRGVCGVRGVRGVRGRRV